MSGNAADTHVLERLFAMVESRKDADAASSYTAKLLSEGRARIAQKLGEEAIEAAIAAVAAGDEDVRRAVTRESADLLYHLLVLWAACGVAPADVWAELAAREGESGLEEKARRGG